MRSLRSARFDFRRAPQKVAKNAHYGALDGQEPLFKTLVGGLIWHKDVLEYLGCQCLIAAAIHSPSSLVGYFAITVLLAVMNAHS
jgi:hypothetical protein